MIKDFKSSKFIAGGKGHHHSNHGVSRSKTLIEPWYDDEGDYKKHLESMQKEMAELQSVLWAEKRQALLVIFQGMDTAGKDSAIAHVMSGLNPSSVTVSAFSSPSKQELAHDFLWRTHAVLPTRGKIGIFNRSYYEEVSTVRVHPEYLKNEHLPSRSKFNAKFWQHRLDDIRHHEDYLERQGTRVLKIFLNISSDEQRKRLLARIDDRDKNWKFDIGDVRERALWTKYHQVWDEALAVTSTPQSPWYVIPADDKKNARLMISQIVIEQLSALKPEFPVLPTPKLRELKKIRLQLQNS